MIPDSKPPNGFKPPASVNAKFTRSGGFIGKEMKLGKMSGGGGVIGSDGHSDDESGGGEMD